MRLTLLDAGLRPDWKALRLALDAFEPKLLGRENVCQQFKRTLQRIRLQRSEDFPIGPGIVGKLAAYMFEETIHCFGLVYLDLATANKVSAVGL